MLDQVETLAGEATFAVGILGNVANGDFELVPLGRVPAEVERRYCTRRLVFLGVFGLRVGQIGCALECPLPPEMQINISAEFERLYWREIAQAYYETQMGDSASWCERLFRL
jgi:hypothetical protein